MGQKFLWAQKISFAPEAFDSQPITYNAFSNRELLARNPVI